MGDVCMCVNAFHGISDMVVRGQLSGDRFPLLQHELNPGIQLRLLDFIAGVFT